MIDIDAAQHQLERTLWCLRLAALGLLLVVTILASVLVIWAGWPWLHTGVATLLVCGIVMVVEQLTERWVYSRYDEYVRVEDY